MDIGSYLQRIEYTGEVAPTLSVLKELQKQHLLNIPFENLDIHANRKIELDTGKIFEKIVLNRRGGFCYELNGLFFELLREIGFSSKMISGRVFDKEKGYGNEYDHLAIITALGDAEFLVDVGFGEFVFHPLRLVPDLLQKDERGDFIIERHTDGYYRVSKLVNGEWTPQYLFSTKPRAYLEFEGMCHYHQTSPHTHFTKNRFLGIPTAEGRITLIGNRLKIVQRGEVSEREIGEDEFAGLLVNCFKFNPPPPTP